MTASGEGVSAGSGKRQLRVAIVSPGFPPEDGGGIGTYTHALAAGLVEHGHRVTVITRSGADAVTSGPGGCKVLRFAPRYLPKLEPWFPGYMWSRHVARVLKAEAAQDGLDVVEFPNWEGVGHAFLRSSASRRCPGVVRLHTPFLETIQLEPELAKQRGSRFICRLEEKAVMGAAALCCSTVYHAGFISDAYRISPDRIRIVPLGIPDPGPPVSTEPPGSDGDVRILYLSRLERRKGTLTFLDALPRVLEAHPAVRVILAGMDRPQAPGGRTFQEYFLGLCPEHAGRVEFRGFIEPGQVAGLYRDCDVFCVPSNYESFGLVFLEAMSHAKPVVACAAGGVSEVVENGRTGHLVVPGDSAGVADHLIRLCADGAARRSMGEAGRRRFLERFTIARMTAGMEAFYAESRSRIPAPASR